MVSETAKTLAFLRGLVRVVSGERKENPTVEMISTPGIKWRGPTLFEIQTETFEKREISRGPEGDVPARSNGPDFPPSVANR